MAGAVVLFLALDTMCGALALPQMQEASWTWSTLAITNASASAGSRKRRPATRTESASLMPAWIRAWDGVGDISKPEMRQASWAKPVCPTHLHLP